MMRTCQEHFDELLSRIHEQGLDVFCAEDAEQAVARLKAGEFDPLASAYVDLLKTAVQVFGPPVLKQHECPICLLIQTCRCGREDCGYRARIRIAVDDAYLEAMSRGLISQA